MESERNLLVKNEKPPVLFHASRSSEIKIFEPRAEKVRDADEGPKVFATPSRAMASIFLVDSDDSWVQSGAMNGAPYIIISDEEKFRKLDTGGYIYSLPNDTFKNDPKKGLRELEWTSSEVVKPVEKEFIPSALADMIKHGVKIYFVDKNLYERILDSNDHGESIIHSLSPLD